MSSPDDTQLLSTYLDFLLAEENIDASLPFQNAGDWPITAHIDSSQQIAEAERDGIATIDGITGTHQAVRVRIEEDDA